MSPRASPWRWLPSLYIGQGLPYAVAVSVAVVMYKTLGVSNTDIALITGWLYLPWVLKPLWSPWVERGAPARVWIVGLQFALGVLLGAVAWVLPGPDALRGSALLLWLLAFASATHDVAADGYYLKALSESQRAAYVGVRSTCWRLALIGAQGGLVVWAGELMQAGLEPAQAWAWVMATCSGLMMALALWHRFALPTQGDRVPAVRAELRAFFRKPGIVVALAFLLTYRLGESQLVRLLAPFMLDPPSAGGLGLHTSSVGWIQGTAGVAALLSGGVAGGVLIARHGLDRMIWPMALALNLPNAVYLALALWPEVGLGWVAAAVVVEQLGYGFGFAAYMVYMMMLAEGEHAMSHYALCTGFMALGMMLPGMAAGWIQSQLGYVGFFLWVCVACIPAMLLIPRLGIRPGFGRAAPSSPPPPHPPAPPSPSAGAAGRP